MKCSRRSGRTEGGEGEQLSTNGCSSWRCLGGDRIAKIRFGIWGKSVRRTSETKRRKKTNPRVFRARKEGGIKAYRKNRKAQKGEKEEFGLQISAIKGNRKERVLGNTHVQPRRDRTCGKTLPVTEGRMCRADPHDIKKKIEYAR